ncbi:hypothetical protein C8D70_110113 [Chryseobacterium sp. CBTAP 102]|jgi:hypothetical protein|nr:MULTISPECIES: hypothetical protein [unclassified Chryseobacterium]PXW13016.1 hypothetical protein C8D70_110113 [Chryseobacterium sp. CBTAP 102]SIR11536.1 hypothetical protein SAMN05880573_11632 [Chryseobacterium sp. RU33C]
MKNKQVFKTKKQKRGINVLIEMKKNDIQENDYLCSFKPNNTDM